MADNYKKSKSDALRESADQMIEAVMELVCDNCVHTYRDTQGELDAKCEKCAMAEMMQTVAQQFYALGVSDMAQIVADSVRAAREKAQREIEEQYGRNHNEGQ